MPVPAVPVPAVPIPSAPVPSAPVPAVPVPAVPVPAVLDRAIAQQLKRDAAGLIVAVVQQHDTGEVLMVGWMDEEALHRTLNTGRATYWSRSRQEYWVKGATSGHHQYVKSVALDCDGDSLLVQVDQVGAACHTGDRSCFNARRLPASEGSPPQAGTALAGTFRQ